MKPLILVTIITMISIVVSASNSICAKTSNDIDYLNLSIEELMQINITAEKREQKWYETALTVDVYDGRNLRDNNVHQFGQLSQLAPGLVYGHIGNTPYIYLRGIGSDLISIAADSSTAVYSDDVYLARPQMAMSQFWDVDRIEILKGPQGALYGRNATGGAINIIHPRPTFDHAYAYANILSGGFSTRQLEAAANYPISESLTMRSSIFTVKDNGFTTDIDQRNGNKLDDNNIVAARIELRWQLNDKLENFLMAETYQNNNHSYSLSPTDHKGLAEQLGAIAVADFHQTRNDLPSYNDYKTQGISWRWVWNTSVFEFESLTAYRNLNTAYLQNTDGTEIAVTASNLMWESSQRSQEFKFTSTTNDNWRWLAGASWLNETPINNVGLIRPPINTSIDIFAHADTTAWAVYGEVEWNFQPQWSAKLGLRESEEVRKDGNKLLSTHDLFGLDSDLQKATSVGASQHNETFSKLSPQFILSFTPESKLSHKLWYFSTTEGFKSGGANSFSTLANFKPEEIISVELGYKYSAKNITWQLAGFHYDYKDLQVLTYESGVTTITNAANATLKGIDANLLWEVDNNWSWQAGVTALKANYDTFITSQSGVAVDVSGKVMPYAPQWDFNQTIHYQHALPLGKLQLSLHHHYQSRTYFNQFSDKTISEPSRHIYNAQAMWKLNQHWNFSLSVMNLTDENYYEVLARFTSTSIASAPEGNALGVAAPGRQFLANIHYGF